MKLQSLISSLLIQIAASDLLKEHASHMANDLSSPVERTSVTSPHPSDELSNSQLTEEEKRYVKITLLETDAAIVAALFGRGFREFDLIVHT